MNGASSEGLRREVWNALTHCIVSNRGLWDTVDIAEVKRVMEPAIAALPWRPLTLVPLWRYFAASGTPDLHARETLLFFASRGMRWGITVELPPELELLTASERAVHIDRMRSLGGSSGTFVGRAPVASPQTPSRAAPTPVALPPAPAEPPPEATSPTVAGPAWPLRAIGLAAARVALIAVAGMLLVNGVRGGGEAGIDRYRAALGDMCSAVTVHGGEVLCTATPAAVADPTKAAVRAEAVRITLNAAVLFVDDAGEVIDPLARFGAMSQVARVAGR